MNRAGMSTILGLNPAAGTNFWIGDSMLYSSYKSLVPVKLPYAGRQCYMHTFDIANPVMAEGYENYLKPVTILLEAAGIKSGIAHMTVDEKAIKTGYSQRRPGPHVDGCFMRPQGSWAHPMWDHGQGVWLHNCNNIEGNVVSRMPVIVAASVAGCRAWEGTFNAEPKNDGDLSHVELGDGVVLDADMGYLLSPDCIHESMRFDHDVRRSFLRIALPTDFKGA